MIFAEKVITLELIELIYKKYFFLYSILNIPGVFKQFYQKYFLLFEVIVPPAKKLEDLIHLTELCVDLLQQNEEHYAEVS